MKNKLILLALLFVSYFADAQKYIQTFTKADGGEIAISLQNIAFVSPSGTLGGSVLMTGPTPKAVYVTDTLANIVSGSAAMLVELTEIRSAGNRQVGVSKQHVQEIVPSGANQTLLKLKNPVISVLVSGAFSVIADSLAAESGGGGTADGNGIYSSSDTVPEGTLATIGVNSGSNMDFAIGQFPAWPNMNFNYLEKGVYVSPYYWGGVGMIYGGPTTGRLNTIELGSNSINIATDGSDYFTNINMAQGSGFSTFFARRKSDNHVASLSLDPSSQTITVGTGVYSVIFKVGVGDPEGVVSAGPGSFFFRTDGGAGTSFYVKESGTGNTGWVGK